MSSNITSCVNFSAAGNISVAGNTNLNTTTINESLTITGSTVLTTTVINEVDSNTAALSVNGTTFLNTTVITQTNDNPALSVNGNLIVMRDTNLGKTTIANGLIANNTALFNKGITFVDNSLQTTAYSGAVINSLGMTTNGNDKVWDNVIDYSTLLSRKNYLYKIVLMIQNEEGYENQECFLSEFFFMTKTVTGEDDQYIFAFNSGGALSAYDNNNITSTGSMCYPKHKNDSMESVYLWPSSQSWNYTFSFMPPTDLIPPLFQLSSSFSSLNYCFRVD